MAADFMLSVCLSSIGDVREARHNPIIFHAVKISVTLCLSGSTYNLAFLALTAFPGQECCATVRIVPF